jgi:hypothetical protein
MNLRTLSLLTLAATASLGLGACAVMPSGPTVMALPGSNKTFDQFRGDDYNCRQFAFQQIGGTTAQQNANAAAVGSTWSGRRSAPRPARHSVAAAARPWVRAPAC